MLALIDNYDSFTYNLVHFLGELGADAEVIRNDAGTPADILDRRPSGLVLSPGPCDPDRAGMCLDLLAMLPEDLPVLGVCLGHQAIGQAFGGRIVRAPAPMHGKLTAIDHDGTDLFAGLPSPLQVTRYHSLMIDPAGLPDCLVVTATAGDGVIMAIRHRTRPIFGVQFHPESIASQGGHRLLAAFARHCGLGDAAAGRLAAAEDRLLAGPAGAA